MESAQIARRFLSYFEQRGHTVMASASLVAQDPAWPAATAGMAACTPFLLGERTPPFQRAASAQKCVRTPRTSQAGPTSWDATFFQMLGNFSFGDYFKEQAIPLAWELLTGPERDGGFGFPASRLWVTVHTDDDVAARVWRDQIGLPDGRIQRRGMADNFWSMAAMRGPCTQIYYDRGPEYGGQGGPVVAEDRYLELWNLVFLQYEFSHDEPDAVPPRADYPTGDEEPGRKVGTGMSLERMAAILQGVDNAYEVDTIWKVLDRATELTDSGYGRERGTDISLRVIADHVRAAVMLVADGVVPGDEAHGYLLRRLLRRSSHHLRLLAGGQRGGARGEERFLHELAGVAIEAMGEQYPELISDAAAIHAVIDAEEESFLGTLRTGTAIFEAAVEESRRRHRTVLGGEQAFQLHDAYGFPLDLTLEMAAEHGLTVDEEGFRRLLRERRQQALTPQRAADAAIPVLTDLLGRAGAVTFTGYDAVASEATILGLLVAGASVSVAAAGTEVDVVLDRTPFYAEGGGQLADAGVITAGGPGGGEVEVFDVQQPVTGLIVHRGKIRSGEIGVGMPVHAEIDVERRRAISRSHTATHLVHRAFRGALGAAAAQLSSENSPGRFRLDFAAAGAVPASVIADVEDEVNEILIGDLDVRAFYTSAQEAQTMGALVLAGETYGAKVRVVEVGDYSRELCGGTHVARSGQLGLIKILGASVLSSGMRRVEALVGLDAFRFLATESLLVSQLAEQLHARPDELPDRVASLVSRLRTAERELKQLQG
jgi:alanyl-tRNA synthetase